MNGSQENQLVVQRDNFIKIIQSAISLKEYRFANEIIDHWLSVFPQDINITYYKALVLYFINPTSTDYQKEAIKLLENICQKDPDYFDAISLLTQLYLLSNKADATSLKELSNVIKGSSESLLQPWAHSLLKARLYLSNHNLTEAENYIQDTLKIVFPSQKTLPIPHDLVALLSAETHILILYKKAIQDSQKEDASLLSLAEFYYKQWNNNLVFQFIYADLLMAGGRSDEAVSLLHHSIAADISGSVAVRCFGVNHPYLSLWPKDISTKIPISIPASIAAFLGWNQLPTPTINDYKEKSNYNETFVADETIAPNEDAALIQPKSHDQFSFSADSELISTLDEIAKSLRAPLPSQTDARFPVYIILSAKEPLKNQFGEDGFKKIDDALSQLATITNQIPGWNARILYVDDTTSAAANNIKPVLANDPWAIKLALADFDKVLQKTGEMIGAVLIVGGPEIIPFHSLPNPVDDPDTEVFSDNPYSTRDENYFIPEWSVGRITAGKTSDASKLVDVIQRIIEDRQRKREIKPWFLQIIETILNWIFPIKPLKKKSMGYTAAIWKDASLAVFKTIGEDQDLLISPPMNASSFSNGKIIPSKLAYFNLHGVEDSPEWYGQKDPIDSFFTPNTDDPHRFWDDDYPVALRPQNLESYHHIPEMVFTEACYGAFINKKSIEDALSLKFLSLGTKAFIGSTSTAYGSVTTPLTAADLLCRLFWQYVQEGLSAGAALKQAKISLAKEMHQRQGYLDGEDQKTLIQFILLGDPLAKFPSPTKKGGYSEISHMVRSAETSEVITVQEKILPEENYNIDPETLRAIKEKVAKYLPGMENADINISQMISTNYSLQDNSSSIKSNIKTYSSNELPYQVITMRKSFSSKETKHVHIARLTIDPKGNILKMTCSR